MTANKNTFGTSNNVYLRFPVHPHMFLHTLRIQNSVVDFLQSSDEETFVFLVQIDVLIFFLPVNECLLDAPLDLLSKSQYPLLLQLLLIKNVCVTF